MPTWGRLSCWGTSIIRMLAWARRTWRATFIVIHHMWRGSHRGPLLGRISPGMASRWPLWPLWWRRLRGWWSRGSHFGLLLLWIGTAWRPRRHLLLATSGHGRGHGPWRRRPSRRGCGPYSGGSPLRIIDIIAGLVGRLHLQTKNTNILLLR